MNAPRLGVNQLHAWVRQHHQVSEAAMAVTFAEYNDECWRFNVNTGTWLQWVGTHWAREQTPELMDALRNFLVTFSKALVRAQIISNAEGVKFQSQRAVSATEKLCRALPSFVARDDLFDSNAWLLGTPGGTVDLRDGSMRQADPADHITILTTVTPAPAGTPVGPKFQAFMDEVMAGNRDLQRTMQQWAGNGASGSARDQMLMFLYGPGRNGKGVYCKTIAGLLGKHVSGAGRDLFMEQNGYKGHPTELVKVVLSRMCIASEIPEGATWDVALIKSITGNDIMEIRRMRENGFDVVARCTLTIMGNLKPEIKTVDEAIRGRFLVVTFPVVIPIERRVAELEKVFIAEEGPSILRWIIDGAVDRERSGRLHIAQVILDDTRDYFAEENVMEDYLNTCFERQPADSTDDPKLWRVKTGEAYELWRAFCGRFGRKSGSRNPFTTAMKASGVEYARGDDGRFFTGIRMRLNPFD